MEGRWILEAIHFILPAYVANATPSVVRGRRAIDGGRLLGDGWPIFGSNKTIEGFAAGLAGGTAVSFLLGGPVTGFLLALGALGGDLVGSFIKRRLKLVPGTPLPFLDQLGFVVGAVLVVSAYQVPRLEYVVALVVVTPLIHVFTHLMGYLLGLLGRPL